MPIMNYTTSIKVSKTLSEIQSLLIKCGAKQILLECGSNPEDITAISFQIFLYKELHFRLPSNHAGILQSMKMDKKVPRNKCTKEHAQKVSWRIIKDWLEAQLALIQAELATNIEIFLPYMLIENGQTFYEAFKEMKLDTLLLKDK